MVERGLADSTDRAARLVMAGSVHVAGRRIEKPGELIDRDVELHVKGAKRFVSRGGDKLEGALRCFDLDVSGLRCLDAGCSTGGFTDCLLQHGAAHVVAVDVGYGDFDWKLRNDVRVTLLERTNIRALDPRELSEPVDLVTADLSFIGLATVLTTLVRLVRPCGELLLLVKPQFELPRAMVSGGVVRDPALHERAIESVEAAARAAGTEPIANARSVLEGPDGNVEYFVHLRVL